MYIFSTAIPTPDLLIREVPCAPSVEVGDVVRMDVGAVVKADATNLVNSNIVGIVEALNGDGNCTIRVMGLTGNIFTGLSVPSEYFLSDTLPGKITASPPVAPGSVVVRLGQALDSQRLLLFKSTPLIRT